MSEDSFPEKEIAKFIHAIENYVVPAVSADAAAAEFRVHGDLSPTEAPNFETSATFSLTRPVSDRLRKDLEELPDVRPKRERVPYYLVFTIAGAAADPDDAANAWRHSGDSTAAAVAAHP